MKDLIEKVKKDKSLQVVIVMVIITIVVLVYINFIHWLIAPYLEDFISKFIETLVQLFAPFVDMTVDFFQNLGWFIGDILRINAQY